MIAQSFNTNGFLIGDTIVLFDRAKSSIATQFIDNTNTDVYYEVEIISKKNDRFQIKLNPINYDSITVDINIFWWIETKNIGVGLRNCERSKIPIYDKPKKESTKKDVYVYAAESVIANITDIKENWLKISFETFDKKKITGWLSPNNQCFNLFTMCCGS
jgi:hypothetical protein